MVALDLTPQRIAELFLQLDAELHTLTDRRHDVMIAGGAAVALLWNQQRITNDVDVVSEGMTPHLREAVRRVARDYDLEPDWFNDAAKLKAPSLEIENPVLVFEGAKLRVYAAPASHVLAMKLVAGRDIDKYDIPALITASGVQSREELYRLVDKAYPLRLIPAATGYLIDQAWEQHQRHSDQSVEHRTGLGP